MSCIFGKYVSAGTGPAKFDRVPRAAHSSLRLCELHLPPNTKAGIWLPPGIDTADALFTDEAEDVFCLIDGEISNKKELQQLAGEAAPTGLAEILVRLLQAQGAKAFSHIRGGFAVVIGLGCEIYAAVDRFGMKKLAMADEPGGLVFSSDIRWLGYGKSLDPIAIHQFLNFSFVPTPKTVFVGVEKIPCGTYCRWNGQTVERSKYWEMRYPENALGTDRELAERLRFELQNAVSETCNGLNPSLSGCYLSGGTDSSTVLGMTRSAFGGSLDSFSIAFDEDDFSELEFARAAAKHFGSNHHVYTVKADDGWRTLPILAQTFDEPFANPSAIGGFVCAELAAQNGKEVLLAGDGGDELFAGNERYRKDVIFNRLARARFLISNPASRWAFSMARSSARVARLQKIIDRALLPNPERFYLEDCLSADLNGHFLAEEFSALPLEEKPLEILRRYFDSADATHELNRLLFVDLKLTIADNDLVKVRETAAACGVRVRFPMLEHPLAEFSGHIPAMLKVKGTEKRYLFKLALRNFLPNVILDKTKHGFGVPVSVWFREDRRFRNLVQDVCSDRVTLQRGFFKVEKVKQILGEHDRGFRDWGQLLYALVMLELSLRDISSAA